MEYLGTAQFDKFTRLIPVREFKRSFHFLGVNRSNGKEYEHDGGGIEWMVWQRIEEQAILSTIDVDQLRLFIHAHPEIEEVLHTRALEKTWNSKYLNNLLHAKRTPASEDTGIAVGM